MNALERLVANLARLPGLGRKSASRIAYYLLRSEDALSQSLAADIASLKATIRTCSVCGTYTDVDPCPLCTDPGRDDSLVCVVEEPQDVATIESTREYRGRYHVLMGAISPIDGVGPGNLRISGLVDRVMVFISPQVIGAAGRPEEADSGALAKPLPLADLAVARSGTDILIEGRAGEF